MEAAQAPATEAQAPAEPPEPAEPHSAPGAEPGAGEHPEDQSGERDEQGKFLSAEAARYRTRLRETEGELERTREQLDRLQRAEVERLASGAGLAVAADVWLHGASLDTLRTEDGDVDPETVHGLVEALVRDRPGLKAPVVGSGRLGEGSTAAGRLGQPKPGLSQLLKPGRA